MFLISKVYAFSQKVPEDFGYRHLKFKYLNDPVDVIIISKKGEERLPKPLFLFCQGSLPQPVVKYDENGLYGTLPFNETPFLENYHIAIIAKPFIPVISNVSKLGRDFMFFRDFENEIPPKGYIERNYLDYYVFRNNFILKQLFKERWIKTTGLLVAGHSEGSTVAAKMASINKKISKLIYSSGNPYGRIINILEQSRRSGNSSETIEYWTKVVSNSNEINIGSSDSFKATYSFSLPQKDNLMALDIPVLVTFGNSDLSAAYNNLLQMDTIREKKRNMSFIGYENLEHNYFSVDEKGNPDFSLYYWDKVANDWINWLKTE